MDVAAKEKLNQYIEDNTLRFASTGTATIGNKLIYTSNSTGNLSIGTIAPSTQLSITGDVEVRDGSIRMTDNSGIERARLTADGMVFPQAQISHSYQNPYSEQIEQTRQDLFREIEQHLNQTQERVVEERVQQQSLLNDLELGTLDENYIKRMQKLAGIDINGVTVKLNGVEIIDEGEAEQPVVHSNHNWVNKIKSGYEKAKVYIRGSKMAKGTEQPVQTIQD
jgi:hypothetical protein